MLQYITDHDERFRRLEKHGVTLPAEVQGWHFPAKANITKEQRQMVMTQANSLERTKIQQAMYSILGQDYKHSHLPHNASRWSSSRPSGKGRGFHADAAHDDEDGWGFLAEDDDMAYYEYDDGSWDNDYMLTLMLMRHTSRSPAMTQPKMTTALTLQSMMSVLRATWMLANVSMS